MTEKQYKALLKDYMALHRERVKLNKEMGKLTETIKNSKYPFPINIGRDVSDPSRDAILLTTDGDDRETGGIRYKPFIGPGISHCRERYSIAKLSDFSLIIFDHLD